MRIGIKLFLLGILVSSICSVLRAAEMARADTLLSLEDESGMQMRRDASLFSMGRSAGLMEKDTLSILTQTDTVPMRKDASLFSMGRSAGLMGKDTISVPMRTDTVSLRTDTVPVRTDWVMEVRPLAAMPLLILAATAAPQADWHIRNIRNRYFPHLRMHWDDYVQIAPLALSLSLPACSITPRGGSAYHYTAHSFAVGIALLGVLGTKYAVGRQRPQGNSHNSFPSGHTATAFLGAELLDLAYGERYPLLASFGYLTASLTAYGRILNNRHWGSDVLAGAAAGILSADAGYWLADLVWGQKRFAAFERTEMSAIVVDCSQGMERTFCGSQAWSSEVAVLKVTRGGEGGTFGWGGSIGTKLSERNETKPSYSINIVGEGGLNMGKRMNFGTLMSIGIGGIGTTPLAEARLGGYVSFDLSAHRSWRLFFLIGRQLQANRDADLPLFIQTGIALRLRAFAW